MSPFFGNAERQEHVFRVAVPCALAVLWLTTCTDVLYRYLTHHPWDMGEWLINYAGGFVRRGFFGSMALVLSGWVGVNPGAVVAFFQMLSYGVFFGVSWSLLRREAQMAPFLFLVISPFLFGFPLLAGGCHRKEILLIALFAGLVWLAKCRSAPVFEKCFYGVMGLFPLLVLSHEALVIYLPYFLILFFWKLPGTRWRFLLSAALLVPSGIAFLAACIYYRCTAGEVQMIMDQLRIHGYPVSDGGAIPWVGQTREFCAEHVARRLASNRYHLYGVALLLIAAAFYPVRSRLRQVLGRPLSRVLLFFSIAGTVVLCTTGVDWGRYIYIHAALCFLICFLPGDPVPQSPEWRSGFRFKLLLFAALLYSGSWFMPHVAPRKLVATVLENTTYAQYAKPYQKMWRYWVPLPSA